jgi:hypothetical protein
VATVTEIMSDQMRRYSLLLACLIMPCLLQPTHAQPGMVVAGRSIDLSEVGRSRGISVDQSGVQWADRGPRQLVTLPAICGRPATILPGRCLPNGSGSQNHRAWWALPPASAVGLASFSVDNAASGAWSGIAFKSCNEYGPPALARRHQIAGLPGAANLPPSRPIMACERPRELNHG